MAPLLRGTRLEGFEKKIREETDVDLETGRITIRRVYGKTTIGPEWVADLPTAIHAAGRRAALLEWRSLLERRRASRSRTGEESTVTIDIPVEFPDAVADVIGQGARLNLTGSERITFSGTTTIIDGGPRFESQRNSLFPDLDMKQQLRVNLDGTIGRKIHVLLNHDSEANTDLSNKIQLRYDGDEDEVVQKIEMGNTELALPGAEFLSFRKSQQGLFGAKAIGKFGPLDLTAIASKQEGKTARQSFVGQSRRDSVVVRDVDYVKRKYYWVKDPEALADSASSPLPILTFELFLDDKNVQNDRQDGSILGFAFMDATTGTQTDSTGFHRGFYHRLIENQDYQFNRTTGSLTLESAVSSEHAIACFYTTATGDSVGNLAAPSAANPDSLVLELQILAPPQRELYDDTKGFVPARDLELKNVYYLQARNVLAESLELRIRRRASTAGEQDLDKQTESGDPNDNVEYVRVLGLDTRGINAPEPDGLVEPEFIDFEEGTITFPNLTPFAPDSSNVNVIVSPNQVSTGRSTEPGAKLLQYNAILYTQEPTQFLGQDRYQIEAKYTTPTPTYTLNRFNILEGSERVRLNGRPLSRGADYDIDYEFGILTFKTPEANATDAQIEVDFEFVPLFGQSKESLAGISGTYNFDPQTRLSSSWLFYSKASPELRPRLGQEPSRILVGNLFGQWLKNPASFTNVVNAIPLVNTESESEVQIQGEVALSLPNPNTKNEIYIDDMEGVEDSRDLTITRALWVPASEPVGPVTPDLDLDRVDVPKFPFNWYNPDNVVRRKEVFPELTGQQEGEDFLQVLEFAVRDEPGAGDPSRWMGVMRNLSVTGEDFSQKKFLEIWVNDFQRRTGRLVFDLGEISEDFYLRSNAVRANKGRGFLDTEDFDTFDGQLTVSKEDLGLDNVDGVDGQAIPGDDNDDDFEFDRKSNAADTDFRRINNTENNSVLDTEDLDNDNLLDTDDAYLSYVLDLADSVFVAGQLVSNPFIVQDNGELNSGNGWRLFQIPLDNGETVGGVPRRRAVKYARLWFDGLPEGPGQKIQVASLKIVGASWLEEKISTNDTVVSQEDPAGALFTIKDVNNKEDAVYAGQEPFDPGLDSNRLRRREQSLVVDYLDIPSSATTLGGVGRQGSAFKEIVDSGGGKNQDFTQYESLSFFLRDGQRLMRKPDRPDSSQGTFFLRFGPDTTNFYEFSTKMDTKWSDWNEVFLRLNDLAALKLDPPETTRIVEGAPVPYRHRVVDGDTLAVYGAPSLTRVRRLTIGVRGDEPNLTDVSGILWFNEIRLRSVKRDPGIASRVSGTATFADFATFGTGVRRVDSEFRRIDGDRLGNDELAWNVRGDLKLNKFLDGRGLSLPVTAEYNESRSTPLLSPNSDIELEDPDDKRDAETKSVSRTVSARIAKTRPSPKAWVRYTLDNLSLSMSDTNANDRGPFQRSKRTGTSGQASYNLNPGQGKSLRLLKRFDFSYFPTVKLGVNGALNVTNATDIQADSTGARVETERAPVRTRNLDGTLSYSWDPLRSASFDSQFTFNKRQDLDLRKNLALWESAKAGGREDRRDHASRLSWRPGYVRWLRPVLAYDTHYDEDQGPGAQAPDVDRRLRRVSNSANREISATLQLRQLMPKKSPEGTKRAARRPSEGRAGRGSTDAGEEDESDQGDDGIGEATPPVGGGAAEVDEKAPADSAVARSGPPKLPSLSTIGGKLVEMLGSFGDIRYSYGDRRSSRYSRVGSRPDLLYQLGVESLEQDLLVQGANPGLVEDRTERSYVSKLDTTFQPTSSLFFDGSYARTITRNVVNDTRTKTEETTFPDLSVSLDGLERHGFLKRLAKTSTVNSSYRKSSRLSGKLPPLDQPLPEGTNWFDTRATSREFTPLAGWSTSWNSGVNTTVSYDRKTSEDEKNFVVLTKTKTFGHGLRLNGRYSFSAPKGVSFLGKRLRFRSDMTLNFDFERTEDKVEEELRQPTGQTSTSTRSHQKTLAVKPRATYNFSRKIQGSLDVGYSRTKDLQRERTDTAISVAVEALIKF